MVCPIIREKSYVGESRQVNESRGDGRRSIAFASCQSKMPRGSLLAAKRGSHPRVPDSPRQPPASEALAGAGPVSEHSTGPVYMLTQFKPICVIQLHESGQRAAPHYAAFATLFAVGYHRNIVVLCWRSCGDFRSMVTSFTARNMRIRTSIRWPLVIWPLISRMLSRQRLPS
jgi:hypothetical protein